MFRYLVNSDKDLLWGLTVDSVGFTLIEPNYTIYPPLIGHPDTHYFDVKKGRILDSYLMIYITKGSGVLFTSPHKSINIVQGDILIIRPNVWHSYMPNKKTGWEEYWMGMKGSNVENWLTKDFLDPNQTVYHIGDKNDIVDLYKRGIEVASDECSGYQQVLAGIADLILGLTMYYNRNCFFVDKGVVKQIDKARSLIRDKYLTNITLEEIALEVNMSYSWFRRVFKEYTNLSPARYIQELKLQKARQLLTTTDKSIKQIAFESNFSDASHFSLTFKKHQNCSPQKYRDDFAKRAKKNHL